MDTVVTKAGLAPFSLKDSPTLIERVFPAQKLGAESQKERKAGSGQTLTALGSYWKGRKPLVLVRATVLASLLPATDDPEGDLDFFEMLMRMDDEGLLRRSPKVTAAHVWASLAIENGEKLKEIEPPTSNVEENVDSSGVPDDEELDEPSSRKGSARWLRIDLDVFDQAIADAKATLKLRLSETLAAPISKKEKKEAVEAEKASAEATINEFLNRRSLELRRVTAVRSDMMKRAFLAMPFSMQVGICERVEKVENFQSPEDALYAGIWDRVNARLHTNAFNLPELVEQLGIARFGHRPVVGDPFCGGGSIPFEAARVGCDVVASDLNPVAAMLTWGALNILGADKTRRLQITEEQRRVATAINDEMTTLGIEHNEFGDRAKAYLYCLEVIDPQTGWRVPMSPSWVISSKRKCVARLVPDYSKKRFDLIVEEKVTNGEMRLAAQGTVRDGYLIYRLAPIENGVEQEWRFPVTRLRGDGNGPELVGLGRGNLLRQWSISDVTPREPTWVSDASPAVTGSLPGAWYGGDIWLERLFAIQWIDVRDIRQNKARPRSIFAAPNADDLAREAKVISVVAKNLSDWQSRGIVPDMAIETGVETARLMRERGWTYWHHLYTPRQIHYLALTKLQLETGFGALNLANVLNFWSRLCGINVRTAGSGRDTCLDRVFINQALNTLVNYGCRASAYDASNFDVGAFPTSIRTKTTVVVSPSKDLKATADVWVYDPPYADAVHYHEITEYFIAWLRGNPPPPFDNWKWDSKRPLAIQGKGEKFRSDMVAAFTTMARHMPDNGLQVCMFTHKDAAVWADMAQIVWAAGLQTTAAWYVSTETTSELKQGGYVQGTVLMVLRKRKAEEQGFRSDIVPEVRARVAAQVETLTGLNQKVRGRGRDENVFSDADIQMAGYAAALEVLTGYTHIDGVDMTREALRPRVTTRNAVPGIVEEMIALAVQTANELMVPEDITEGMWERLSSTERFYLKMTNTEATWPVAQSGGKLDDYQNFARVYRAENWEDLMAEQSPNKARLKGAAEFKRALMTGHAFAAGSVRPALYAISEQSRATAQEEDPKVSGDRILHGLRDHFGAEGWLRARDNVRALASWFGLTWQRQRPDEAAAARVVAGLIGSERLGG